MKISRNFQHLRIVKDDGLTTEYIVLILFFLSISLFLLLLLWQNSGISIWFILQALGTVLILGFAFIIGRRICIDVDANVLSVKYEPISFGDNKEVLAKTLRLIYYEASQFSVPHRKPKAAIFNPFRVTDEDYVITTYRIYAVTNNLETVELLSELESKGEALLIAKEINQFLHLEDNLVKIDRTDSHDN
jgi:hypothetical protein